MCIKHFTDWAAICQGSGKAMSCLRCDQRFVSVDRTEACVVYNAPDDMPDVNRVMANVMAVDKVAEAAIAYGFMETMFLLTKDKREHVYRRSLFIMLKR